jgi:hypothetical protein
MVIHSGGLRPPEFFISRYGYLWESDTHESQAWKHGSVAPAGA